MNKAEFLDLANGRARTRTFDEGDYDDYQLALAKAKRAGAHCEHFYRCEDAGGVANTYGYMTTTARWTVYVSPVSRETIDSVGRVTISSRRVPCGWKGGERAYLRAWFEARAQDKMREKIEQMVDRDNAPASEGDQTQAL